jgi:hypothetical protein
MKAKELIEKLKGYEDFDLKFLFLEENPKYNYLNGRTFTVEDIDIGYSDNVIMLAGDEEK